MTALEVLQVLATQGKAHLSGMRTYIVSGNECPSDAGMQELRSLGVRDYFVKPMTAQNVEFLGTSNASDASASDAMTDE